MRAERKQARPVEGLTQQNRGGGERKLPGGARDSRAVCGDPPQTADARVIVNGVQIG